MLGGGGGGGGGGGAGLGLDFSAVIQAAVVGLVLFSAAVAAVRRAASRYFVVDAAGFAASYDDHHHHPPAYPLSPQGKRRLMEQGQATGEELAPCAECGDISTKKCSGCKRVRYCSQECQLKHWQSDHKLKCKHMKLLDPGDKLPCGGEANSKKSSGFGRISLVPAHGKLNKVIFPYDEFLKLYNWNGKDIDLSPCGLVNCGNSCFANVVLQCLSFTRPLVAYLLGKNHSRECSRRHGDWCFLCELQCHIQRVSGSLHPFAPMNVLSHLPNIGGNLGFGRQEDAHEFMRFAVDKMQSACLDEFGGEKAVDLSIQETTLIQHIFGGRLQSQVQCTACGMVSNRYDNMMDLTVEIQGDAESLEECLDQFTAIEWLDGDNKYKCDGCSDYVKARKHLTVHQAPNILTITLKRFQSGRFGKLNKRVTFPTKLDLTPYMSTSDGSDLYDLYAVVVHLDMLNASFFGHYICYIKDCRGCWHKIDDCKVMVVDKEEVHAQGAYMLLYSRRTARPRPLIAVKEPVKQQQQCKVPPSNGQNHLIPEDATLKHESFSKHSEDLQDDFASSNKSLNKMDTMDRDGDWDLHISIERDKFTTNENQYVPVSSVLHVPEEATRSRSPGPRLEGCTTMRSMQLGNSTCEASSVHSSAEQCEEPAPCIDSVANMEVDTEAGTEVKGWNEELPVLDNSIELTGNKTSVLSYENGMAGKPKPIFSLGLLDNPLGNKSSFAELLPPKSQIGDNGASSFQKSNGPWNGHLSRSEQGVIANSLGIRKSFGSAQCNGDMFATSSNGKYSLVNGDTQSSNDSLHADKWDVPFVSHGFNPRPHKEPSGSHTNQNNTSNGKPLVGNCNKSSWTLAVKDCKGDMPFLRRGFLERPCSGEKSFRSDDGLPFINGASSSFVNGNSKSSNNSSQRSKSGTVISPVFLTKRCRESAVMGTSANPMHDLNTSRIMSKEQKSVDAAVLPDQIQESWSSDRTTNCTDFQHKVAFVDNASGHRGENGHAVLGTKNTSYREESTSDGTLDMNDNSYQRDDASAMLVSEEGMGSENADHLKFISATIEHDGLRRRLTSKLPEKNVIDAQ